MPAQLGLFESPPPIEPPAPAVPKWKDLLRDEYAAPYFQELRAWVKSERAAGKTIYPPEENVFHALAATPFEDVKVVILGQDPYHGPGQAHGLCFSVLPGVEPPPSLKNIFKELQTDLNLPIPNHGYLEKWARQGVLLLNAVLTVEASKPNSHKDRGWEKFTDKVVEVLNEHKTGLVFLLWGAHAQRKGERIDSRKHFVLKAPHPSPFSAASGFFGCKHFSKTNQILTANGKAPIDWRV